MSGYFFLTRNGNFCSSFFFFAYSYTCSGERFDFKSPFKSNGVFLTRYKQVPDQSILVFAFSFSAMSYQTKKISFF